MDRSDLKNRGVKHLHNKNKYKSKKGVNKSSETGSAEFSKSGEENLPLGSNRDRYKSISEDEDDGAADFGLLADAPISVGGHFQFKSSTQELSYLKDSFLSLDISLLNCSIGTVPFNVRCEIDEEYLQGTYLDEINKKVARNKKIYEQYLQNVKLKPTKPKNNLGEQPIINESIMVIHENSKKHSLSLESYAVGESTKSSKEIEKEELEEWLDDVLNT